MAIMRKKQEEIKSGIDALLWRNRCLNRCFTTNDKITINKFSRLLPIASIESFNEIENSLTNSEEDFSSLV